MPHFIINSSSVKDYQIRVSDKELYNHIVKALRAKTGESLMFIDENEVQYITKIEEITRHDIYTKVVDFYKSDRKLPLNLYLAQSVLKPDAQFNVIQKATELGVKGIIPLYTDNCTVKQGIIKEKIDKWQKIAIESVKQCERADIPKVFDQSTIEDIIKKGNFDIIMAFVEKHADSTLKEYLSKNKIPQNKSILAIIGPEGGFSEREFKLFKDKNIPKVSLGNLIYRADTAVIAALSNLIYGIEHE